MQELSTIGTSVTIAKDHLLAGQLIGIPTETVYGLAGNATDSDSVARIFKVKNRPHFDPLIVHLPDLQRIEQYAQFIPEKALLLLEQYAPGPITVILKKRDLIPDLATSGLSTAAFRIPRHPLTLKLLKALDFPLAAPSANPFGYVSPTTAQHVIDQLGGSIPYVLDGGPCEVGVESTIVDFSEKMPKVLRFGGLSQEDIEQVIGQVHVQTYSSSHPAAPGMLLNHYAPSVPIKPFECFASGAYTKAALLTLKPKEYEGMDVFPLSASGSLLEASKHLFALLRKLDSQDYDIIYYQEVPDIGLGRAINDRLRRASAKYRASES